MTSSIKEDIEVFENRYRKKEGGIAYNLWSARWDASKTHVVWPEMAGKHLNKKK
jgi:hypothetical protein